MKNYRLLTCLAIISACPAWAQDAPEVVQLHCARCHGVDGLATQPDMPHLNGQLDTYLHDVMRRFQKGSMPTEVSDHVAKTLSVDNIETIAKYYAGSKATRPKQVTDPDKVGRGETIFRDRCVDCHADNGREADKDAPLVAAQDLGYMVNQIKLFTTGKRKFGFLQDDAFRGLSNEELESVIHFFASQEQFAPKATRKKQRR